MFQILYKSKQFRCIAWLTLVLQITSGCALFYHEHDDHWSSGIDYRSDRLGGYDDRGTSRDSDIDRDRRDNFRDEVTEGIAVGAVVSLGGSKLEPYQRWRYADQLASYILEANPDLKGRVDSYQYVSRRMGKPFETLVKAYRLDGELRGAALDALTAAQLRRRHLMMVSILPVDEEIQLPPERKAVIGRLNAEVDDYYTTQYQTIRLLALQVQVYDTVTGNLVSEEIFRSDDDGVSWATERKSVEYVGNSLLATLSNSALKTIQPGAYPKAPDRDDLIDGIWQRVAASVPDSIY